MRKLSFHQLGWMVLLRSLLAVSSAAGQTDAPAIFGDLPASTAAGGAASSLQNTNLATGTVAPNIPLLSLPGRSYTVPVSLSYTAGAGVKVNDVASEVGLGWNLNAGGYVLREVKDRPDEQIYGWLSSPPTMNGAATSTAVSNYILQTNYLPEVARLALGDEDFDSEPDLFTLVLPTGSAQFVFERAQGQPGLRLVLLNAQNLKIETTFDVQTAPATPAAWTITTDDGTRYAFGGASYQELATVQNRTNALGAPSTVKTMTYVHKWLLHEIRTPSGEVISHTYHSPTQYSVSYINEIEHNYMSTYITSINSFIYGSPYVLDYTKPNGPAQATWNKTYYQTTTCTYNPRSLATITTALGRLEFIYGDDNRLDVTGTSKALQSLVLRNVAQEKIKQLDFVHAYKVHGQRSSRATEADRYHLMLSAIVDVLQPCLPTAMYEFSYNENTFSRNSPGQDFWGYLNDPYNVTTTGVAAFQPPSVALGLRAFPGRNRAPHATMSKALILERITTALGGHTQYAHELHDFGPDNRPVGGLRIKSITQHDGKTATNDLVTEYSYRRENNAAVSSGCWQEAGVFEKLQYMHGHWQSDNRNSVAPNNEERPVEPLCPFTGRDFYYLLRSTASMYETPADYIDYQHVTVRQGDGSGTSYTFTSWDDPDHRDYIHPYSFQKQTGRGCAGDPLGAGPVIKSAASNVGYNCPLPRKTSLAAERGLLLRKVERNKDGLPVSKTENDYEYKPVGYADDVNSPAIKAMIVTGDLDAFGFTQKSYYYQIHAYKHLSKWCPLISTTQTLYDQTSPGDENKTLVTTTLFTYSHLYLSKAVTTTAGETNEQVVEYRRPLDLPTNAQSPDNTTYAGLLTAQGRTGTVLEEVAYLRRSDNTRVVRGASITEYKDWGSGRILPYKTYSLPPGKTSFTPLTRTQAGSSWSMAQDPGYLLVNTITTYTAEGQPLASVSRDGLSQTICWGYNQALPIATVRGTATPVAGADPSVSPAGYSSCEDTNGASNDGWGAPALSSVDAKTGSQSARLVMGASEYSPGQSFLIPPSEQHGKFLFSAWTKAPAGAADYRLVIVAKLNDANGNTIQWAGSPTYRAQAAQPWKYAEWAINVDALQSQIPASTTLCLQVYVWLNSNSLLVDELRFHRQGAQMATTTHQPLVGTTSVTDANGRSTHQEYDEARTLRVVRNDDRHIVQRTKTQAKLAPAEVNPAFTASTQWVTPGCAVAINATASCVPNTLYNWNFGDDSPPIRGIASQTHAYAASGVYPVTLTVEHPQYTPSRSTQTIHVQSLSELTANELYFINPDKSTLINLCDSDYSDQVTFSAYLPATCGSRTYAWELKEENATSWQNVSNSATYTWSGIDPGNLLVRCLVTDADGSQVQSQPYLLEPYCDSGKLTSAVPREPANPSPARLRRRTR